MTVDNRVGYIAFALRVLAILTGLAVFTALLGIGVRVWAPGFDLQTLQAIAGHRDATLTTIAGFVTDAGSFALLAPLSSLPAQRAKRAALQERSIPAASDLGSRSSTNEPSSSSPAGSLSTPRWKSRPSSRTLTSMSTK